MGRRSIVRWIMILAGMLAFAPARAEVTEIRFAQQFSMGYLQFDVMKHQDLLAKHVAALGLPPVKVSWVTFSGPDMMNDALLSGSIDIASGGMPGLLTIWAKTRGSAQEVRGVSAMSQQPILLNSRNPAVKTVPDFTDADRIAMPAVKVSAQAVLLEMAAAREWGDAAYDRLDKLTFSLSPPDATSGLLAGGGDFNAAFTVPPFQAMQLRDPAIHTVLSSDELVGPSSAGMAWTTKRFHDANPQLYRAMLDAMQEASEFIAGHPKETVAYYAADTKMKIDTELMGGAADQSTL
jgi:NitT/TauT family transport system substrate-binding protein